MSTCLDTWLGLVLLVAAGAKARRAETVAAGLSTYGLVGRRTQQLASWLLIGLELGLGVALLADVAWAPTAAAGLFGLFSLAALVALLTGQHGQPCACFGSRARLSLWTPLGSGLLTLVAATAGFNWLPTAPENEYWLTVGLAVCVAAVVLLSLAVLAVAREVGVLRLGLSSQGALEIAGEGPALGSPQPWAAALPWERSALLGLAIFSSDGCPLCRQLAPAVKYVAADPLLAVRSFDEVEDAEVWRQADVPGSPYAVALDADGMVRATGTFNSLPQLESIIATARTRSQEVALVV